LNKTFNNHIVIYDCWSIADIDRRADWIRTNAQRGWQIEIDYVDDLGAPVFDEDNDNDFAVVDTVTIHFECNKDLVWFKLMWVL